MKTSTSLAFQPEFRSSKENRTAPIHPILYLQEVISVVKIWILNQSKGIGVPYLFLQQKMEVNGELMQLYTVKCPPWNKKPLGFLTDYFSCSSY